MLTGGNPWSASLTVAGVRTARDDAMRVKQIDGAIDTQLFPTEEMSACFGQTRHPQVLDGMSRRVHDESELFFS